MTVTSNGVLCGKCKAYHPTVADVKACYMGTGPVAQAQPSGPAGSTTAAPANIWRKGSDGSWCVQVATGYTTGDTVTVTKRNGDTAEVVLGEFVAYGNDGLVMYAPAPKDKQPATGYTAEAKRGDVHVVDGTYYRIHIAQKTGNPYAARADIIEEAVWENGTLVQPGKIAWEYQPGLINRLSTATLTTAAQAAAFGHLVGRCCFCSHAIDTPESTAVGYGPVCASKYDLPWGNTTQVVTLCEAVQPNASAAR